MTEQWVEVTEGETREGDRCAVHKRFGHPAAGWMVSRYHKRLGCRIERRAPAAPASFPPWEEWHAKKCPARGASESSCWPQRKWVGDWDQCDYGPNSEFVGKTCRAVYDEARAAWEMERKVTPTTTGIVDIKHPVELSDDALRLMVKARLPQYAEDAALGRLVRSIEAGGGGCSFGDGGCAAWGDRDGVGRSDYTDYPTLLVALAAAVAKCVAKREGGVE